MRGLYAVTEQILGIRVAESQAIVKGLEQTRVSRLRQEVTQRQNAVKGRVLKILKQIRYGHYRLASMITEQDFMNPEHVAYLDDKEPEYQELADVINSKIQPLIIKGYRSQAERRQIKEVFEFLRNKVLVAITVSRFMERYRTRYVDQRLAGENVDRAKVFEETYEEMKGEGRYYIVKKHPGLYWAIFYQAAFVSRYIEGIDGEVEQESGLFRKITDQVLMAQMQLSKAQYLPGWIEMKDIELTGEEEVVYEKAIKDIQSTPLSSPTSSRIEIADDIFLENTLAIKDFVDPLLHRWAKDSQFSRQELEEAFILGAMNLARESLFSVIVKKRTTITHWPF